MDTTLNSPAPHEYVVKTKLSSDEMKRKFEWMVVLIREHGYEAEFWGKVHSYLDIDGKKYWTMGEPLGDTIILNRAEIEISHDQDKTSFAKSILVTWNMRGGGSSEAWQYLLNLQPDIALLQEAIIPKEIVDNYAVFHKQALSKSGRLQPWGSAVLVHRSFKAKQVVLKSRSRPWIETALDRFGGSFVGANVATPRGEILLLSCHSPAWNLPVDGYGIPRAAQREIQGDASPNDIWGTDFIWEYLRDELKGDRQCVVGGDFNCSILFDETWGSGNQEFIDSMASLGLIDCVRTYHPDPRSTPTFKKPKDGKVEHQLDYLWATPNLAVSLAGCEIGEPLIFDRQLSDHLPIIASCIFKKEGGVL